MVKDSRRALKSVADRQCGYFSTRQASAAGYIQHNQTYHVKRGNWLKVDWGLYRLPGYADTAESEFVRWVMWATGQVRSRVLVVSHESALFYYGLSGEKPVRVHLSAKDGAGRKEDDAGCVIHPEDFADHDVEKRQGFFILTPEATLRLMRSRLVLQGKWMDTVRKARGQELLTAQEVQRLLGQSLYDQYVALAAVWGVPEEKVAMDATTKGGRAAGQPGGGRRMLFREAPRVPNRSFTLIEMLVVIAIICVLAGMLMPALQRAVGTARQASCTNNLRQCGMAATEYADLFNGYSIYFEGTGHTAAKWADQLMAAGCMPDITTHRNTWGGAWSLASKIPEGSVFACPSLRSPPLHNNGAGADWTGASTVLTYGIRWVNQQGTYPKERYVPLGTGGANLLFRTAYNGAPFMGDSIRTDYANNQPGQNPILRFEGEATIWGNLYLGHGLTGNGWYIDGHVEAKTQEDYFQTPQPLFGNFSTTQFIIAYPSIN